MGNSNHNDEHNSAGRRVHSFRNLSRQDPGSMEDLPTKDNMTLGAFLRIADALEELTHYVHILTAQVEVLIRGEK